jgi:hypothetical protein
MGESMQANANSAFIINSSVVFNHLLVYCVGNMHRILKRKLMGTGGQKQQMKNKKKKVDAGGDHDDEEEEEKEKEKEGGDDDSGKPFLPAHCKPWNALKSLVVSFLRNAVTLLGTVKDRDMQCFLLQRMRHYMAYFKILPKIGRSFLKVGRRWLISSCCTLSSLCCVFSSASALLHQFRRAGIRGWMKGLPLLC